MDKWLVPSFSDPDKHYLVTLKKGRYYCSCPHFLFRLRRIKDAKCKHIALVLGKPEAVTEITKADLFVPELDALLESNPSLIGFDVSGTLEIEHGVVKLETVTEFHKRGWICGIISNRVTHPKFSESLQKLGLDFYKRGSLGEKEKAMLEVARHFNVSECFYCGNSKFDMDDSSEAGWSFIDARKIEIRPSRS